MVEVRSPNSDGWAGRLETKGSYIWSPEGVCEQNSFLMGRGGGLVFALLSFSTDWRSTHIREGNCFIQSMLI